MTKLSKARKESADFPLKQVKTTKGPNFLKLKCGVMDGC